MSDETSGLVPGDDQPDYGSAPQQPAQPLPPATVQNQKALWSLILGIAGVAFCIGGVVFGVTAVVLAVLARQEIKESNGRQHGDAMAITGLLLGVAGCLLAVASLFEFFSFSLLG